MVKYAKYSDEFKKAIVEKYLSNPENSVNFIAKEADIPASTLKNWLNKSNKLRGFAMNKKNSKKLKAEEKFDILVLTASMNEAEKSEYCRSHGFYPEELEEWKSDIKGMFFYLYMIIDIYSRKIIAWEIHEEQSDKSASQLIKKAYMSERINGKNIVLHSDNGSPMKGATMLATLQALGIATSFSRPSVSNDNPYSEAIFKTLKYKPGYPSKPFDSLDHARSWVHDFTGCYNFQHKHSALKYVTPVQKHNNQDEKILEKRKTVYKKAKLKNPSRWSGDIRNWDPVEVVYLNPDKHDATYIRTKKAA